MAIAFPAGEAWDGDRDAVTFAAWSDDGRRVQCGISLEALEDHFGVDDKLEALAGFRNHRGAIERVAERLIRRRRLEPDGSVLIRSQDCQALQEG
jgi:uncharacterized protein DUF1488